MNPSINVNANVSGATGGIRQVTKSLEELQRALRDTSRGMRQLSVDERAALDALENAVNSANPNLRPVAQARRALSRAGVNPTNGRYSAKDILSARFDHDAATSERIRRNVLETMGGGVLSHGHGGGGDGGGGPLGGAGGLVKRAILPLAALAGVGGAFSAVRSGMNEGESQLHTLDTYQRMAGLLGESLKSLELQADRAAEGLKLTTSETARLVSAYARQAGIMDASSAANSANAAGGFGRSLGLDPGQTASTFASLEYSGAGNARRMGVIIGETVARTGRFVNAGDFLSAFNRFNEQQAKQTLRPGDMSAFGDMLSNILNFGAANGLGALTPQLTEELMLRLNSSIAGGGTAGEGSAIFLQKIFAEAGVGDVFERQYIQQGGMFAKMGGKTLMQGIFERLDRDFGPDVMPDGTPNYRKLHGFGNGFLGGNQRMAEAILGGRQYVGNMDRFGGFLEQADVDVGTMNPTGMADLMKLFGAVDDPGRFGGNAAEVEASLRRSTNPMAQSRLGQLEGLEGLDRIHALARIVGEVGREDNLATDTMQAQVDLRNAIRNLSEEGIPAINGLRVAIVKTAGFFGINATETEDQKKIGAVETLSPIQKMMMSTPWLTGLYAAGSSGPRGRSEVDDDAGAPPTSAGGGGGQMDRAGTLYLRVKDADTGEDIGEAEVPPPYFGQPAPTGMGRFGRRR